jgi:hypothetical protein
MKKYCLRLVERLRDNWPPTLIRSAGRNHDRFRVDGMVSFNFGGGSRELLLKVSPKHMPAKATSNERFAV